jgi:tetratricopeptide (TPR) repeat protein
MGNYQIALDLMEDVIGLAERAGENPYRARAYNTIGWIYREIEDHQKAIEYNRRGIEEAELTKSRSKIEVEANARINLGDSLFVLGQLDKAEEQFQHIERIVRDPEPENRWMLWRYAQHLFHSCGELCLARGQFDKALNYADECLMLAEESESKKNIVKAQRLRGQTFMVQGDLISADQALSAALEVAKHIGNPPQLWKTLSTMGDLRRKQGRLEESITYQDAFSVVETVASKLEKEDLREKFLNSKHIQEIQSAAKISYN